MEGKQLGNVIYFDPNNVKVANNTGDNLNVIFSGMDLMKDPEDLSIAIDLEVVQKSRNNVTLNDGENIKFSMVGSNGENSFLQGKKIGETNVLTSFFTDITYTGDEDGVNNEAMCINSIDIEFQSWYVASVVIKFTDIRGSALFSPSEDVFNQNPNSKTISEKSVFSGFFTYPYPIFKLKIKGFYGDAVTYPLHMVDFKSEFNADKGTYDITTSFIGYTYALLNDIQMPYLLAAPYTKEYGETYWNEQVKNGRFKTLEGGPLQRIPDMLQKIKKGEFIVSNLNGSNENVQKLNSLVSQMSEILSIKKTIDEYLSLIDKNYSTVKESNRYILSSIKTKSNSSIKYVDPLLSNDPECGPYIQTLYSKVNVFIQKYKKDNIFSKYEGDDARNYFSLKSTNKRGEYKLDLSEIIGIIDTQVKQYNIESDNIKSKIESSINNTQSEAYGMVPSIYNFTKMLLAHMETLLYSIAKCAKSADSSNNRQIKDPKQETDLKLNEGNCLPFPGFSVSNREEWIGNYYPNFDEVRLVRSFVKAKSDVSVEIDKIETSDIKSDIIVNDTEVRIGDVWLPINAFDNSIENIGDKKFKPYSNIIKETSVDSNEIKNIISTRIATIVALSNSQIMLNNKSLLDSIIQGESENIIEELGKTPEHTTKVISALNGILEDYKKPNIDTYTTLIPYVVDGNIQRFKYNLLNSGILPLTDDTIKTHKKRFSGGKLNEKIKYFYDGNINIPTDQKKYPKTSVSIVEGVKSCDFVLNNWISPLKQRYTKNMQLMFSRYDHIEETESEYSISEENYEKQPLMNRIAHVGNGGISIEKGKNDAYYQSFLEYCGLDGYIFKGDQSNPNLLNMYKFYLGYDNKASVNNTSIDVLNRKNMFSHNKNNSEKLTYPLIGGNLEYISGRETTVNPFYLFGHPFYYEQNNNPNVLVARKNKAFLFLQTLPIYLSSFSKFIENEKLDKSFMCRMTKAELLLLGSMLWRNKNGDTLLTGNEKSITLPDTNCYFRKKNNNLFTLSNDKSDNYQECVILKYINGSGVDVDTIIKYFEDWTNDKSSVDGWINIQNNFELHSQGKKFYNGDNFKKIANELFKQNSDTTLMKYIDPINLNNYWVKRSIGKDQIGLIAKDGGNGVKAILSLMFNECIFSFVGYGVITEDGTTKTDINYNTVETIVKGLIKKVKEHKKTLTTISISTETQQSSVSSLIENNEDISLQTYKYLKTLYDKWVSGYIFNDENSEYKWINDKPQNIPTANGSYLSYDLKNFKFLDRAHNNIGYKFIVNYKDIFENYISFSDQKTLYSTITDVLGKNNFLFVPMPNYQRWDTPEDFSNIFKPVPFNSSKMLVDNEPNTVFLCLYSGEPSKKLNVNSENYVYADDSLNLNADTETTLPEDFMSNKLFEDSEDPYRVPTFAVNYGKQNQQYFKNIRLSQTNPVTTEASLMATYNLVKRADSASNVGYTSQDMYTIYSNYSYTCQIDMPGCAQIQPMMYFQLTNIPMWNGAYLIYKTNHSITPGNMTTSFTGVKMPKSYPKLVLPMTIGVNNFNVGGISVAQKSTKVSDYSLEKNIGPIGYFKLKDYIKGETSQPLSYIVARLEQNVAPIIDGLMDSWMASDIQRINNYGKFIITNGYRNEVRNASIPGAAKNSMHVQALAVDLQLEKNNNPKNIDALFEHVRTKMKVMGLKIDQLIREDDKTLCHIGVAYTNNVSASVRGEVIIRDSKGNDKLIEIVENAKTNAMTKNPSKWKSSWVSYWKESENSMNNPSGGWRPDEKLWYAHDSAEGGAPTIGYGIKLINGYLQSTALKSLSFNDLTSGIIGITDSQAINEIITQSDSAYNDIEKYINKKYGSGKFENIADKYKYGMVDIYLNHGAGNFKSPTWTPFIKAAINNDLNGMLNNCDRGSNRRTALFKKYLQL